MTYISECEANLLYDVDDQYLGTAAGQEALDLIFHIISGPKQRTRPKDNDLLSHLEKKLGKEISLLDFYEAIYKIESERTFLDQARVILANHGIAIPDSIWADVPTRDLLRKVCKRWVMWCSKVN